MGFQKYLIEKWEKEAKAEKEKAAKAEKEKAAKASKPKPEPAVETPEPED